MIVSPDDDIPVELLQIVDMALGEDVGKGDITSESLFDDGQRSSAVVVAREKGVLAGIPVFQLVYDRLPGGVECRRLVSDGGPVKPGEVVLQLEGPTIALMKGERTALNFLQRLSGIATRTRRLVDLLEGSGITLLDTRKTTPGHRALEKYAVRMGGGENHRRDLSEMILVKENHITAAGGIAAVLEKLDIRYGGRKTIEVEVRNLEELNVALNFEIDRVMLDNFSPEEVRVAVTRINSGRKGVVRPRVEVSGGIGEDNIEAYRIEGVDCISIGSLTHSIRALDLSMIVESDIR